MTTLFALVGILAALALWAASLRAREHALGATQRACRDLGVALLDETVELTGLGLQRSADGRLRLQRRYTFEFTPDGRQRHRGWAVLVGTRAESLQFEYAEGVTILEPGSAPKYGLRA